MLISFRCSNYKSFDKDGVLVMTKGGSRSHPNHVADVGQGTLKHAVIYGSNASGKSSLISAMAFSRDCIVREEFFESEEYCRINKQDNSKKPTVFEYVFTYNGHTFDYGFSGILSEGKLTQEWLYVLSEDLQSHECVYQTEIVDGKRKLSIGHQFTEEECSIIHKFKPRPNGLRLRSARSYFSNECESSTDRLPDNIKLIYDATTWFYCHLYINSEVEISPSAFRQIRYNDRSKLVYGSGRLKLVTDELKSIGIEVDSVWTEHHDATPEEIASINKHVKDVLEEYSTTYENPWEIDEDLQDENPWEIDEDLTEK